MWKVVYITSSGQLAERIQVKLTDEGFLVRLEMSLAKEIEVLVPASEAKEVQEVLREILHVT